MIQIAPKVNPLIPFLPYTCTWWSKMLPEIKGMVKASIVFGTPGKNCQGLGLCKAEIIPDTPQRDSYCPKTFAYIGVNEARQWEIRLPKVSTPGCIQITHLQTSTFRMEEPFQFPEDFYTLFNTSDFIIQKGSYYIKETKLYFLITFSQKDFIA